jgi:hypothetical protein
VGEKGINGQDNEKEKSKMEKYFSHKIAQELSPIISLSPGDWVVI